MLNLPGKYCRNRVFEWVAAFTLLGLGFHLMVWPGSIETSKFVFVLNLLGTASLMSLCIVLGTMRGAALYLNGNWPIRGAQVRMVAAGGAALVWVQMLISLIFVQHEVNENPSPSIWIYSAFTLAEVYSCYRAAADARAH